MRSHSDRKYAARFLRTTMAKYSVEPQHSLNLYILPNASPNP